MIIKEGFGLGGKNGILFWYFFRFLGKFRGLRRDRKEVRESDLICRD